MNGLLQDLRIAVRGLRKRPGFAVVAILILALGSGITTLIFSVISGVLLKPLEYPQPDKLVTLHVQTEKRGDRWGFSYPDFIDTQRECHSFEGASAWTYSGGTVSAPGEPEYVDGRLISSSLFSVLRVPLLSGRSFLTDEDHLGGAPVAIISARLWQQRFGAHPKTVGMPLNYDGKTYTIVGIAPAGFQLDGEPDVFTPIGQDNQPRMQWRGAHFMHVVARLRGDVTSAQAQTELDVISKRLAQQYPDSNAGITEVPHPLKSELVQDVKSALWLLFGAVAFVLLIACTNAASLFLTRVISRQHEFGLQLALGAPAGRVLRQCLTESTVLSLCGGLLGLTLAIVGSRSFVHLWPEGLPRANEIRVDWRVFAFAIACSVVTGLIFGLIPALRANRNAIDQTLRSRSRAVMGNARRPLSGFVICQLAAALVLLSAAGILGRTFLRLSSLNPGIDVHNVLTAHVAVSPSNLSNPKKGRANWQELLESVRHVPGVQSAALTDIVPMRDGQNVLDYSATAALPPQSQSPEALASAVTPDYLSTMRLPLMRGRSQRGALIFSRDTYLRHKILHEAEPCRTTTSECRVVSICS